MREGRKRERLEARRPPIMPRGERLFWSTCVYLKHVCSAVQSSPRLRFSCSSVSRDGVSPLAVSGLEFFAC